MQDKGYDIEWLESLKARNDIVSTISRYIPLEKKGRNFWGRCPFHHERTPSFSVNEIEQYYHCFGCGESGDVIKFVEKYESVDFMEAIKILAGYAGMEVPSFKGDKEILEKKKLKERILLLLDNAKNHYMDNLLTPKAKLAQDYIKKRKLTGKELKNFQIGYSLDWKEMISFLKQKGFTIDEMKSAGMVETKNGNDYDVFGERLMFPIVNIFGDCVGFSGRILVKSDFAKYKNTSQTLVFDKSKLVYGINLVKKQKQESGLKNIIIVEGQMDVIAMHRAGFTNTVACMGTALTPLHAKEIKKLADNVLVCFDGDGAGKKATLRSLDILKDAGLSVRVVSLPEGKDPDEILNEVGADGLKKHIDNALPIVDYRLKVCESQFDLKTASGKSLFLKDALAILRDIDLISERDAYLTILKDKTNVPIDVLRRDLGYSPKQVSTTENQTNVLLNREDGNIKAIKFLLASLLHKRECADYRYNFEDLLNSPELKKLYEFLKDKNRTGQTFTLSHIFDVFDVDNSKVLKDIVDYQFDVSIVDEKKYFRECLWSLKEAVLKDKQIELTQLFKNETDLDKRRDIANEINKTLKQLKNKDLED